MNKRRIDNIRLAVLAKALFDGKRRDTGEVDAIISNPALYASVVAKINENERANAGKLSTAAILSFIQTYSLLFSGAAIILIMLIGAASLFRSETNLVTTRPVQAPEATPDYVGPGIPPKPDVGKETLSAGPTLSSTSEIVGERISAVPAAAKTRAKHRAPVEHEPQDEFYALSIADLDEGVEGGRVIRVDMPRSSLFALGANVSLENGPEMVKADLLIGPDGTTRAIRVVK